MINIKELKYNDIGKWVNYDPGYVEKKMFKYKIKFVSDDVHLRKEKNGKESWMCCPYKNSETAADTCGSECPHFDIVELPKDVNKISRYTVTITCGCESKTFVAVECI